MGRPLKIAKAEVLTLTGTTAASNVVTVSQTLADYNIIPNMPFAIGNNTGGLIAGTIYYVLRLTGASTFTVSATPLNANPNSTEFDITTNTSALTEPIAFTPVDTGFNNPDGSSNTYSVVGGNTNIFGQQVVTRVAIGIAGTGTVSANTTSNTVTGVGTSFSTQLTAGTAVEVNGSTIGFVNAIANNTSLTLLANSTANVSGVSFVYADDEAGYIVRQKGKQKYLVKGLTTGLTAACYTANVANTALTPNTMSIVATYANASTAYVQSLSDHTGEIFGTNQVLGNASPVFVTFNGAVAANVSAGIPYEIVDIQSS